MMPSLFDARHTDVGRRVEEDHFDVDWREFPRFSHEHLPFFRRRVATVDDGATSALQLLRDERLAQVERANLIRRNAKPRWRLAADFRLTAGELITEGRFP